MNTGNHFLSLFNELSNFNYVTAVNHINISLSCLKLFLNKYINLLSTVHLSVWLLSLSPFTVGRSYKY